MAGSVSDIGRVAQCPPTRVLSFARPCTLFYAVGSLAVVLLSSYVAMNLVGGSAVRHLDLALAIAVFAAAQLCRIFHRVRGEAIMLAWGEVGVITALCLVPASWLPIVVTAGTVIGHGHRLIGADKITRARVIYTLSVLTVGGAAAATVVVLAADPTAPLRTTLDDVGPLLPLALAGAAYYLTTSGLSAAWAAATTRNPLAEVWLSAARAKRTMLVIGVPTGIAITFAASVGTLLVAVLTPFLWLIHQVYAHHLRSSAERRIWTALADATRSLHQLDEQRVASAALQGCHDLFAPMQIELNWRGSAGPLRNYASQAGDTSAGAGRGSSGITGPVGHEVSRPLVVGGVRMGELSLRFRHPLPPTAADEMALSTFADAVASAMHDVGTHRRLQHLAARSAYEAIHDPLTGLSNRSTLLARGNFELRRGSPGRRVALVLLGVDRFRAVNETLNYDAGDELLRLLARRLVESRQDGEILGRLGGDEFALLLSGGSGSQLDLVGGIDPIGRASELAAALAVPTEVSRVTLAVEVSAGVVVADAGACDAAELLRRADVALHQAKRDGRRVMRYDAASDPASTDRLALLAELRDALATTDQLVVDVQPAIDLHTGAPVSAEVLARWRHPRRGLLQPAEFIPPMEHSELASGFTLYVLGMGLRIAAGWATQGIAVPVSVNLCARCLVNPELPSIVAHDLSQLGVPPERLILEMSESVMDGDEGLVRGIIDDVRDRGMQVSVDDFGTGPASLSLLTRFAVDEVKIDRSFVAGMADSPETAAIVRTTVDLARELDLRVVAEGVELPAQRAALMDLGVTVAQGFLFHPPVSVTDATAIVQGRAQLASARSIPIVTASAP